MLPGFRFLFAAILLSISILVFGVGAAALLRATHEQFVANPSWRNGPQERTFAQAAEPAPPVLAALRVEPVAADPAPSLRDRSPTTAEPTNDIPPAPDAPPVPDAPTQPDLPAADAGSADPSAAEPVEMAALLAADSPAPAAWPPSGESTAALPEDQPATADVTTTITSEPQQPAEAAPTQAPPVADAGETQTAALRDPKATADTDVKTKAATIGPEKPAKRRAHRKRKIVRQPPPPPPVAQQAFYPFPLQTVQQPAYAATPRAR